MLYHLIHLRWSRSAVSLSARLSAQLLFVLCEGSWVHGIFQVQGIAGDGALKKTNGRRVFLTSAAHFFHFHLHKSESGTGVFFSVVPEVLLHTPDSNLFLTYAHTNIWVISGRSFISELFFTCTLTL